MRVVVQKAKRGKVTVEGRVTGEIGQGLVLLVGFTHNDTTEDLKWMVDKIIHLRIFEDEEGKMNRSLLDVGGKILSVSQFTLYADARKGRRPGFTDAARPEVATPLYNQFNEILRAQGIQVETGIFGASMEVELVNDGPVTILLDSDFRKG
jgi:D-tyrosyl-tRNA(Tyr) deacylase